MAHAHSHSHDHHHGHAHSHGPASPHPAQATHWSILSMTVPARLAAALVVIAALWARGSGLASGTVEPSPGVGLVPDTPNMVAGLVLTWPALDVIKTRARTRVESALVQQASAARDDVAQAIESQVRLARDTLAAARRVAVNTAVELAAARAAESQATARYRAGLTPVVEVAEAQRLLAQAESDDAAGRANIWRALLLLSRAVGDLSPFLGAITRGGR